jgi:hypothetical protein
MSGLLTTLFGVSFETSYFIVDGLEHWWLSNKDQYRLINQSISWLSTWIMGRTIPAIGPGL